MSAELLARKVVERLRELRNEKVGKLRSCKPRLITATANGIVPAATVEEIALQAVDINATVDAFDTAIRAIEEEWEKIQSPEESPQDDPKIMARKLYG